MKITFIAAASLLALAALAAPSRADDYTGRWGVGVDAGWGARLGSRVVRDTAGNGAALGASITRGLTPNWRAALNYENIDLHGKRFEPFTVSGIYAFTPGKSWTPFVELGLGGACAGRIPDSSSNETALATKASAGLEYALCSAASAAAKATLYNAGHTSGSIGHEVDAAVFSVGLNYWFGGRAQKVAKAESAPAPKPAPVVAAAPVAPAPAPVAPPPAPKKKVSVALDVQFETSKDVVRPQFDAKIKDVADFMKAHPAATAEIEGHTDNAGSKAYNTGLSQRRADSVRRYLIEHYGIDGSRLTAKGYGPDEPIADNKTAEGRAQNRRVVATIDAQE
jgi:outer membrane protein OmpA-like peptidoglycan-associated protein